MSQVKDSFTLQEISRKYYTVCDQGRALAFRNAHATFLGYEVICFILRVLLVGWIHPRYQVKQNGIRSVGITSPSAPSDLYPLTTAPTKN
jgi:hypothetical protein